MEDKKERFTDSDLRKLKEKLESLGFTEAAQNVLEIAKARRGVKPVLDDLDAYIKNGFKPVFREIDLDVDHDHKRHS